MKANYVKPTLKSMEIDAEGSMLAAMSNNNLRMSDTGYIQNGVRQSTTVVESADALAKQGSFPGNQWEEEE
jgi:hypothetical protein